MSTITCKTCSSHASFLPKISLPRASLVADNARACRRASHREPTPLPRLRAVLFVALLLATQFAWSQEPPTPAVVLKLNGSITDPKAIDYANLPKLEKALLDKPAVAHWGAFPSRCGRHSHFRIESGQGAIAPRGVELAEPVVLILG
jgi:hypothetical protein